MSHELGGQALLILYGEGQFINLNHFTSNCLMITFILASIYSDVREGGQGPYCPLSSPLCTHLRDEAEGMDDERGTLDI